MSKKRIKGVSVFAAAGMILLVLSGCATGASLKNNNNGNPASTAAVTAHPNPAGTAAAPASATNPGGGAAAGQLPVTGPSQPVTILETGSSLLYPLFNLWAPDIQQAYPNINLQAASTGSGTGIAQAASGVVQIGASDAYMSKSQLTKTPDILNIPLAISAQQINYNLPGVKSLKLSGTNLAGIYTGKIQYWDDQAIQADNAGINLPHKQIIPVHRTDGSGDTFLFTQYLSATDGAWQNQYSYNTSINWPSMQGALGAQGNSGMVQTISQTPYSLGYVGISFLDQAQSKGLGTAALKNKAGNFVLPSEANISAAASAVVPNTPADERVSLINAPGQNSYPIINYEYAIVTKNQSGQAEATGVKTVLLWAVSAEGGNQAKYLKQVHFLALPDSVKKMSQAQIQQISAR